MTQEKSEEKSKVASSKSQEKVKEKRDKDSTPSKVVIRRLPPGWSAETFMEHISPIPDHDYFHFIRGDMSLVANAFSRAYINFLVPEDIFIFQEKFDDYVFVDSKGNEYPAVVEFAPFQKIPKKKARKSDSKKGTLESDSDYCKFVESLENPMLDPLPPPEALLEEIEAKERELKANHGVLRVCTPLIDYIKKRKEEKKMAILRIREDRRRKELERKRTRDDDRRKRRDRERERDHEWARDGDRSRAYPSEDTSREPDPTVKVTLLKNPNRDRRDEKADPRVQGQAPNVKDTEKVKDRAPGSRFGKDREREKYSDRKPDSEAKYPEKEYKKFEPRSSKSRESLTSAKDKEKFARRDRKEKEYDRPRDRERERKEREKLKESERLKSKRSTREGDKVDKGSAIAAGKREANPEDIGSETKQDKPGSVGKTPEGKTGAKDVDSSVDLEKTKSEKTDSKVEESGRLVEEGEESGANKIDSSRSSQEKDDVTKSDEGGTSAGSVAGDEEGGTDHSLPRDEEEDRESKRKPRYRDRPERAIYNPAKRAAERRARQARTQEGGEGEDDKSV